MLLKAYRQRRLVQSLPQTMAAIVLANIVLCAISLVSLKPMTFFTALLGIKIGYFLPSTEAAVTPTVFRIVGK